MRCEVKLPLESVARVPERGARWPLVGREAQLEEFATAWKDRRCRSVLVCGSAGVGKSRLAEECLFRAVREGWKAGRVTATAAAASVPLGAIAHLIPAGVDLSEPVKGFAAIARELVGPQGDRRWAMLVDDLNLLDATSAVLLRQLLDAGVVRLIGTVRTGEPIGHAVEALTGGDTTHWIDLTAFSERQLESVLPAVLGRSVGRRTLHELFTASAGNVLYLRELVLGASTSGALAADGEIWELAEGALPTTPKLAELIDARLATAHPDARPVLELLALCEPVPLADAQAVSSLTVLANLEAAGLVQAVIDRRRTNLTLGHPLYGEALRAGLGTMRRRQLLLQQADRTQAHGARRREDPLHLATWHLTATGTADPALLTQAAVLARHAHDYPQVAALLRALSEDARTYASCFLYGDALLQMGQWQRADQLLAEAEARALGESEQVAAVLLRSWNLLWMAGCSDEALHVNDTARNQIASPVGQRLLTLNEASLRAASGQPAQGLALLEDLETDPRQAPDISSWAVASISKTAGLALVGRSSEAIEWAQRAYAAHLEIDEQVRGVSHPARQLVPLIYALADAGQLARAREVSEAALADLDVANAPLTPVWLAHFRGRVEWLAGDVAAARRWYAEAISLARALHQIRPLFHAWGGLAAAAAVLGDLAAADATLAEMQAPPSMGFYAGEEDLGHAWLWAARGELAQARAVLTAAAAKARDAGHSTSEMLLLTDIARLGGAKDVTDRLAELAQICDGAFAPARAHLAAALAADDPDQLQAAADELQAIGAHLLAAEAATAAATAWHRTGHPRRATAASNQASTCAAHCPAARTPLLTAPQTAALLTKREREIALAAATGTPSKTIASTLHLSVRTVDNHLQHAYAKLGVTTRHQLATALGVRPGFVKRMA
ncbi:LuxR C-terminal-related transcriptional regulator [Streptomyces sp. NPDC005479]|uniref:helix-turn-helix transcriptional regulator n=1 Tax=Streptomyces sp. NPDC005479 TaxID=3154879 RepID=UPI0033B472FE